MPVCSFFLSVAANPPDGEEGCCIFIYIHTHSSVLFVSLCVQLAVVSNPALIKACDTRGEACSTATLVAASMR